MDFKSRFIGQREGQRYSDYFVKPHNRAPTHRTSLRSSGRGTSPPISIRLMFFCQQRAPSLSLEKFSTNNPGEPEIISNHSLRFIPELVSQVAHDWIIERDMKDRQHEIEERGEVVLLPGEISAHLALQEWRK